MLRGRTETLRFVACHVRRTPACLDSPELVEDPCECEPGADALERRAGAAKPAHCVLEGDPCFGEVVFRDCDQPGCKPCARAQVRRPTTSGNRRQLSMSLAC